jgi:co-chaperonin GroES (HSP10)
MQIIHDYFIVLLDSKYNSGKTESGIIKLNEAYMEDWAEEHLKHRRQYGTILEVPAGYTDSMVDIVTPGLPEPRLFVSGEFIGHKVNQGYRKLPEYYPSTFESHEVITIKDIASKVNVKKGDKVYFDYLVTDPDRYLGKHNGGEMFMLRVDEIYCKVKKGAIMNADGNFVIEIVPQGGWCMVEPTMETWDEITTDAGIIIKPKPEAKYLDGTVRHIAERLDIKEGDRILYQRHADYTVTIEDVDYFVMKEEDILLKL